MTIISLIDLESRGPSADALDNGIDCLQAVWIIIVIIVIIIIINSRGGRGSSGSCIITSDGVTVQSRSQDECTSENPRFRFRGEV